MTDLSPLSFLCGLEVEPDKERDGMWRLGIIAEKL